MSLTIHTWQQLWPLFPRTLSTPFYHNQPGTGCTAFYRMVILSLKPLSSVESAGTTKRRSFGYITFRRNDFSTDHIHSQQSKHNSITINPSLSPITIASPLTPPHPPLQFGNLIADWLALGVGYTPTIHSWQCLVNIGGLLLWGNFNATPSNSFNSEWLIAIVDCVIHSR